MEHPDQCLFETSADVARLLHAALADLFTAPELAAALARPRCGDRRMARCLHVMGVSEVMGKRSNALRYDRGIA